MIISIEVTTNPGMTTFSHNVCEKDACRRGLPALCSKLPSWRATLPKGKLISQKGGQRFTSLSQPHRQPLLFDAQYALTNKNSNPILPLKAMSYPNAPVQYYVIYIWLNSFRPD